MFKTIKLTNFRKHTASELSFGEGLNTIRGPNESAKSTVFEALAYALFGARSLREPLEKAVTWNCNPSTLKVELDFTVNASSYKIKRGKSGAELFVDGKLTVTGQTEVTRFSESLMGASADTTTRLMMANQTALRGALADGPTAAVALIESLANFDLLDTIINAVQENLPTGNTTAIDARIAMLKEQMATPLEDGRTELAGELAACQTESFAADKRKAASRALVVAEQPAFNAAQLTIEAAEAATQALNNLRRDEVLATQRLEGITVPAAVDLSGKAQLESDVVEAADRTKLQALFDRLKRLPDGDEWDNSMDSLLAEIAAQQTAVAGVSSAITELTADTSRLRIDLAEKRARVIKETHCAFCDKDLTDVPEVTAYNGKLSPAIAKLEEVLLVNAAKSKALQGSKSTVQADLEQLQAVQTRAAGRASTYQNAAPYITLDEGFVPARWSWVGPDLSQSVNVSAKAQLAALEAAVQTREQATGRHQEASERVRALKGQAKVAKTASEAAAAAAEPAKLVCGAYALLVESFNEALQVCNDADEAERAAGQQLRHAEAMFAERKRGRDALKSQLKAAEKELVDTGFNNSLLKKLRNARPQVANKLWGMVLHSVSKYFSVVRGVPSQVTRGDNGFLVDGQSVGGLSGSTLDALGLAIRIALTKTFLPNTRWMVLDEPAAACDAEREMAMLGLVAGSDFDQVLLVTHSDLSDVLAAQVIQL